MTLISYAQNYEDVLLWRVLGHVQRGFYIDVGANDPVEHSVTKAFYDAGWSGINFEPLPSFHAAFEQQRPRDINLAIAAGGSDGSLTLYDVPAVNGWASPDKSVAEAHRAEGYEVAELTVPVRTLAAVCAEHVRGEIHFLKVDVEGFEADVLRGMDFAQWRPWVLVVEATLPGSRETNHAVWEPLVLAARYHYAYFDGLNRYYVADEHKELLEMLDIQPNVFDDFITHHLDKAWAANKAASAQLKDQDQRIQSLLLEIEAANERTLREHKIRMNLEVQAQELATELAVARADNAQVSSWAQELNATIQAIHASTSWRLTRPLRIAGAAWRALRDGSLLRRLTQRVTANERMRRLLIPVMLRFPSLGGRVSQTIASIKQAPPPESPALAEVPEELRALPASARRVFADLQRAREV